MMHITLGHDDPLTIREGNASLELSAPVLERGDHLSPGHFTGLYELRDHLNWIVRFDHRVTTVSTNHQ